MTPILTRARANAKVLTRARAKEPKTAVETAQASQAVRLNESATPSEVEADAFRALNLNIASAEVHDFKGNELLDMWRATYAGEATPPFSVLGQQMMVSTISSFAGPEGSVSTLVLRGAFANQFAILTVDKATFSVAGNIQLSGRSYWVSPHGTNSSQSWVVPTLPSAPRQKTDVMPSGAGKRARAFLLGAQCPTAEEITVDEPFTILLGYTPKAKSRARAANLSPYVMASELQAELGDAFKRAGATVSVIVPAALPVAYVEAPGNPDYVASTALADLQNSEDTTRFREERKTLKADVAILLIDNDEANCGMANQSAAPASAYAVVNWVCVKNHSIPHEIGHILGMYHDIDVATPQYAKGFRVEMPRDPLVTIMGDLCDACARVPDFSNARIRATLPGLGTFPIGVDGKNDNACFLRQVLPSAVELGHF